MSFLRGECESVEYVSSEVVIFEGVICYKGVRCEGVICEV